jgi:large subunit ribosomal protein L10
LLNPTNKKIRKGGARMNQNVLESKKKTVEEIVNLIKGSKSVVIVEYRGLSVSEISSLKRDLLKKDAKMFVYKNTMVAKANDELGYEELDQLLEGPNALVVANDEISGANVVAKFAKTHENLIIKGGLVDGKVVSADEIKTLAKLPGRDGLLSMLLSVLQAPVRNLACAIKAVAEKQ